ncbi:MAG TPA: hypothetical protein VK900_13560 [Anaerolineales bacterium]|nr:hypothetical protein [Anaerolineales bacterium]
MTPSQDTPLAPGLQSLIETAEADLAGRLGILGDDIVIVEAITVTWPDASLGCPQEGIGYAQVLTPGYLIRLGVGDREYEYHANRETYVIYCENPLPPLPGDPPDV